MVYTPQTWSNLPSKTTPLSAARLNHIEQGIADLGVFQSYTPTWANVTVGNGAVSGRYTQIGKLVHMRARLTFGTTTSITGDVSVSLPVNIASIFSDISSRVLFRSSNILGAVLVNQSNSAVVRVVLANGTYASAAAGVLNNTTPVTWASGDFIDVGMIYEAS